MTSVLGVRESLRGKRGGSPWVSGPSLFMRTEDFALSSQLLVPLRCLGKPL